MIVQVLINTLIIGSIYALVSIGFNLIYCTTRFFNLAHGVLLAVGGYAFFWLTQNSEVHPLLGVVLAVLFAGMVGWLCEKIVYKSLRDKRSTALVMMVASIGLLAVIQSTIAIMFGNRFRILSFEYDFTVHKVFGTAITTPQLLIMATLIVVTASLALLLKRTRFGKQVRAVGDDLLLAKSIGIDSNKIIGQVFFLGSAITGLTGILIGLDSGIEPTMGFNWLLKGVIAAIIGTIGYWYGGIIGAFLLALIEQIIAWQFSGEWKDAIAFLVLIAFLLFRPNGIFKNRDARH
jgi:branched-chain amino acid transport system permease protein